MERCQERPLFFPKEDCCPELDEMRNEVMMADVPAKAQRQQTITNGRELYNILITYLLEFWRHEVEIRKPNNFFSAVTGFAGEGNWWDMVDEEAIENPGGRRKTRWQEVAESLFSQLLRLEAQNEEFDPENARHLKGLAKIFERGDEALKSIVRNYLSTLS